MFGKGTTDAIIVVCNNIEEAVKQVGAKLSCVDYAKAFDMYSAPQCIMEYILIKGVWRPSTFDLIDSETVQQGYRCASNSR